MQFIIAGVFWCFRTDLVALGLGDVFPTLPCAYGSCSSSTSRLLLEAELPGLATSQHENR